MCMSLRQLPVTQMPMTQIQMPRTKHICRGQPICRGQTESVQGTPLCPLAPLLLLPAYKSSYCLQHWHLQLSTLLLTSSAWSSISFVPAVLPKMAPESSVPKVNHQQRNVNLFALAGRHAPKLDALQHLPRGMHLIGVGRPSDGVAGKCMPARVCMCCPFDLLP